MTVSTGTSAENFWEDGLEEEAECEKFLQEQKTKTIEDEEDIVAEFDESEEDADNSEYDDEEEEDYEESDELAEEDAEAPETDELAEEDGCYSENDTVAESDEDEAATKVKGKKMVKAAKPRAGGQTKAEAIREVIDRRKRAKESLRPRDIIEELTNNGVEVNASQVSVTLRSMGVPPAPKGRIKGTKMPAKDAATPPSRMARKKGVGERPAHDGKSATPASIVEMAVDFLEAAGGREKAVELLDSLARFNR